MHANALILQCLGVDDRNRERRDSKNVLLSERGIKEGLWAMAKDGGRL